MREIILILAFSIIFAIVGQVIGYKHGQIDALNGKVYYCLEVQADKTSAWTYHKEGCDK